MEDGIELKNIKVNESSKKVPGKSVSFKEIEKDKENVDENSKILNKPLELNLQKEDSNFHKNNENKKDKSKNYKCKFFLYIIVLLLHTLHVYIIKPLCVILEIIFLTKIVVLTASENSSISVLINEGQKIAGWIIIFGLPLYNLFFGSGLKIISVKSSFFGKFVVLILLLIEIMFNIPLTFLYENNIFSIFLYEEKGINQILNPWLIFFPTEYILSIFELIRNFLDPLYFFALGLDKLYEIQSNQYQAYLIIILKLMLIMCILRAVGNIVLFSLKIKKCCSKKNKNSQHEAEGENKDDLKASGEENTKDKKDL